MPNSLLLRNSLHRCALAFAVIATTVAHEPADAHDNVRIESTTKLDAPAGRLERRLSSFGSSVDGIGDFDGDGVPDLIARSEGTVLLIGLRPDGSGKPGGTTTIDYNADTVVSLGDLDGDGVADIALGLPYQNVGGRYYSGAVSIVLLNADGTAKQVRLLDRTDGAPYGPRDSDFYGRSLARLDDMDGDGVAELAVGATGHPSMLGGSGAVSILFLNADGTIKSSRVLEAPGGSYYGVALGSAGDVDGDGVSDLAAGEPGGAGAVTLLFLNSDGTLKGTHRIDSSGQDFSGYLGPNDNFGSSITGLGDIDGDAVSDLAVGASGNDAFWTVLLNAAGTVKLATQTTAAGEGITSLGDGFGSAIAVVGDIDGNGIDDLAVGVAGSGGTAVQLFFRSGDGSNLGHVELSRRSGGIGASLTPFDAMGSSLARLGDLDGDGIDEIAAGAPNAADAAEASGSVWIVYPRDEQTIADRRQIMDAFAHGMEGVLDAGDQFGASLAAAGDLDGNAIGDLVAGAPGDDDGGSSRGAVWLLDLDADGTVLARHKISSTAGGLIGPIADGARFGRSVASVGDLDADGNNDIAVSDGQLWILLLTASQTVKAEHRIAITAQAVASVGDLDGDGRVDLAIGQPDSGSSGAVQILFLNADGSLRSSQQIDQIEGAMAAVVPAGSRFGATLSTLGDLDGDGLDDLGVGADGVSGDPNGSLWVLYLQSDGTVKGSREIALNESGLRVLDSDGDRIGTAAAPSSDLNGDGIDDLVLGVPLAQRFYSYEETGTLLLSTLAAICDPLPRPFCIEGGTAKFTLKRHAGRNLKNSVRWVLGNGAVTPVEAFAISYYQSERPDYALCIYDSSSTGYQIAGTMLVQGNPYGYYDYQSSGRWSSVATGGRYDDRYAGDRDGIRQILLKGSDEDGRTKLQLRAMGGSLTLPPVAAADRWMSADSSVIVQLTNSTGACWSTEFDAARIAQNSPTTFKAVQ